MSGQKFKAETFGIQDSIFPVQSTYLGMTLIATVIATYSGTPLKRPQFKWHLVYGVRYCVVQNNFSLLKITLFSSDRTTLVYNDTKYIFPFHYVISEFDCILSVSYRLRATQIVRKWGLEATYQHDLVSIYA
jgi:hypothetical protein